MMTKKDFIALADAIRQHNESPAVGPIFTPDHLNTLAHTCRKSNPRFDRGRWLGYIRGECGPNGGAVRKPKEAPKEDAPKQVDRSAIHHLCEVLEWGKGNRGRRDCNPYGVPEIEAALRFLGELQGVDWLNAETETNT
jgi:hypothetical protein